jgi:hypothetical protein
VRTCKTEAAARGPKEEEEMLAEDEAEDLRGEMDADIAELKSSRAGENIEWLAERVKRWSAETRFFVAEKLIEGLDPSPRPSGASPGSEHSCGSSSARSAHCRTVSGASRCSPDL